MFAPHNRTHMHPNRFCLYSTDGVFAVTLNVWNSRVYIILLRCGNETTPLSVAQYGSFRHQATQTYAYAYLDIEKYTHIQHGWIAKPRSFSYPAVQRLYHRPHKWCMHEFAVVQFTVVP